MKSSYSIGEHTTTHGATRGRKRTREYRAWLDMRIRCKYRNRKSSVNYVKRKIKICRRWQDSFENFLADMGPCPSGLTLDRYPDNNGNYEPGNCRWATRQEQNENSRHCHFITFAGKTFTVARWARILRVSRLTLNGRLRRGWTPIQALTRPVRRINYARR